MAGSQPLLQPAPLWFLNYVLEPTSKIVKIGQFLNLRQRNYKIKQIEIFLNRKINKETGTSHTPRKGVSHSQRWVQCRLIPTEATVAGDIDKYEAGVSSG